MYRKGRKLLFRVRGSLNLWEPCSVEQSEQFNIIHVYYYCLRRHRSRRPTPCPENRCHNIFAFNFAKCEL